MNFYYINVIYRAYRPLCLLLAKEGELAAMLCLVFIVTLYVHIAETKERVRTRVWKPNPGCKICIAFSPEQRLQLSTPSYKIKKDKREAKKLESNPSNRKTVNCLSTRLMLLS